MHGHPTPPPPKRGPHQSRMASTGPVPPPRGRSPFLWCFAKVGGGGSISPAREERRQPSRPLRRSTAAGMGPAPLRRVGGRTIEAPDVGSGAGERGKKGSRSRANWAGRAPGGGSGQGAGSTEPPLRSSQEGSWDMQGHGKATQREWSGSASLLPQFPPCSHPRGGTGLHCWHPTPLLQQPPHGPAGTAPARPRGQNAARTSGPLPGWHSGDLTWSQGMGTEPPPKSSRAAPLRHPRVPHSAVAPCRAPGPPQTPPSRAWVEMHTRNGGTTPPKAKRGPFWIRGGQGALPQAPPGLGAAAPSLSHGAGPLGGLGASPSLAGNFTAVPGEPRASGGSLARAGEGLSHRGWGKVSPPNTPPSCGAGGPGKLQGQVSRIGPGPPGLGAGPEPPPVGAWTPLGRERRKRKPRGGGEPPQLALAVSLLFSKQIAGGPGRAPPGAFRPRGMQVCAPQPPGGRGSRPPRPGGVVPLPPPPPAKTPFAPSPGQRVCKWGGG